MSTASSPGASLENTRCPLVWIQPWSLLPSPLRAHSPWRLRCPSQPPSLQRSPSLSPSSLVPSLGVQKPGSRSSLEPSESLSLYSNPSLAITDHPHLSACMLF
uniref:Heat shock protein family B (Small) member 1 n=1 Tax=Rousettus aegyptiacus TaxID=9407 RepID=A0A7J8EZ26_ROUAE|nr:heat shock protein family B (small) member 1 [Rousettus aegyptiacus]